MNWLWNCSGACFGHLDGDDLWTYSGKHVGRRMGREIYDSRGNYLGEVVNLNRLMTNMEKKQTWRGNTFTPAPTRSPVARQPSGEEQPTYAGHQDFPDAASF